MPGLECRIMASPALHIIGRSHCAGDVKYNNGRPRLRHRSTVRLEQSAGRDPSQPISGRLQTFTENSLLCPEFLLTLFLFCAPLTLQSVLEVIFLRHLNNWLFYITLQRTCLSCGVSVRSHFMMLMSRPPLNRLVPLRHRDWMPSEWFGSRLQRGLITPAQSDGTRNTYTTQIRTHTYTHTQTLIMHAVSRTRPASEARAVARCQQWV